MANYEVSERTNYFQVKDLEEFRKLAKKLDAEVIDQDFGTEKIFGLIPNGDGFLSCFDDDDGNVLDIDILEELGKHVAPGWVACVVHGGHEKLRFIGYQLSCVDSTGRTWSKGKNDLLIEAKAQFAGQEFTEPEY